MLNSYDHSKHAGVARQHEWLDNMTAMMVMLIAATDRSASAPASMPVPVFAFRFSLLLASFLMSLWALHLFSGYHAPNPNPKF